MADRVLIYGVTGSGKTTLARQVADRTGLPWHCVDDLTWEPGWVVVAPDEQRRRIAAICAGDRWILDAAYGQWQDVVLPRTELIVGLDYARWRSLSRLVRRTLARAIDQRQICNGNTESFRQAFSRDSIIAWHFKAFTGKRERMRAWAADPAGRQVLLFRSPAATRRWLAGLVSATPPAGGPLAPTDGTSPPADGTSPPAWETSAPADGSAEQRARPY